MSENDSLVPEDDAQQTSNAPAKSKQPTLLEQLYNEAKEWTAH